AKCYSFIASRLFAELRRKRLPQLPAHRYAMESTRRRSTYIISIPRGPRQLHRPTSISSCWCSSLMTRRSPGNRVGRRYPCRLSSPTSSCSLGKPPWTIAVTFHSHLPHLPTPLGST